MKSVFVWKVFHLGDSLGEDVSLWSLVLVSLFIALPDQAIVVRQHTLELEFTFLHYVDELSLFTFFVNCLSTSELLFDEVVNESHDLVSRQLLERLLIPQELNFLQLKQFLSFQQAPNELALRQTRKLNFFIVKLNRRIARYFFEQCLFAEGVPGRYHVYFVEIGAVSVFILDSSNFEGMLCYPVLTVELRGWINALHILLVVDAFGRLALPSENLSTSEEEFSPFDCFSLELVL